MKITKILISVFLLAFLLGITIFYLIPKTEKTAERVEIIHSPSLDFPAPKIEIKSEPELLEENSYAKQKCQ